MSRLESFLLLSMLLFGLFGPTRLILTATAGSCRIQECVGSDQTICTKGGACYGETVECHAGCTHGTMGPCVYLCGLHGCGATVCNCQEWWVCYCTSPSVPEFPFPPEFTMGIALLPVIIYVWWKRKHKIIVR